MTRNGVGPMLAALLAVAAASPFVVPSVAMADPAADVCAVPETLRGFDLGLERIRAVVAAGDAATILTIGSSSTEGVGASDTAHTYPARLAAHLSATLPDVTLRVVNRGRGGEVVATTAARLRTEVAAVQPDLVIWQVGTNDAVRGVGLEAMTRIIDDGLDFLADRGVDAVLMDPQFYPRIAGNAGYSQAVSAIAAIAARHDVPLVRRFEAMTYWAGRPNPVPMLWRDAFHMNDQGYECIAGIISDGIADRLAEVTTGSGPTIAAATGAASVAKTASARKTAPEMMTAVASSPPAGAPKATAAATTGEAAPVVQ